MYALWVGPTGARALMDDDQKQRPDSLLPYETWIEQALRHVVAQAIEHVAVQGLPGGHHFYITFRTDHPGVEIPQRIRAQYPKEMTIVLQHQFWDLASTAKPRRSRSGCRSAGCRPSWPFRWTPWWSSPIRISATACASRRRKPRPPNPRRTRHRTGDAPLLPNRRRLRRRTPNRVRSSAWTPSAAAHPRARTRQPERDLATSSEGAAP